MAGTLCALELDMNHTTPQTIQFQSARHGQTTEGAQLMLAGSSIVLAGQTHPFQSAELATLTFDSLAAVEVSPGLV